MLPFDQFVLIIVRFKKSGQTSLYVWIVDITCKQIMYYVKIGLSVHILFLLSTILF